MCVCCHVLPRITSIIAYKDTIVYDIISIFLRSYFKFMSPSSCQRSQAATHTVTGIMRAVKRLRKAPTSVVEDSQRPWWKILKSLLDRGLVRQGLLYVYIYNYYTYIHIYMLAILRESNYIRYVYIYIPLLVGIKQCKSTAIFEGISRYLVPCLGCKHSSFLRCFTVSFIAREQFICCLCLHEISCQINIVKVMRCFLHDLASYISFMSKLQCPSKRNFAKICHFCPLDPF